MYFKEKNYLRLNNNKLKKEINRLIELKQKAIIFISHDRVLKKKICKNGAVLKNGVLSNTMRINDAYDFYDQA